MTANRFNFRCWDKEENIMCYEAQNTYDYIKGYPNIMANCFGELIDSEKYILMQSTGLEDRNSKEIYEGDIVKIIKGFEYFEDEVFYDEELCSIRLKGYSDEFCDFADWIREGFEFEVIGNIFENKDLLKN